MGSPPVGTVTATERKSLEKLLEEEWLILDGSLSSMGFEAKRVSEAAIREEYAETIERGRRGEDAIRALVRELEDDGFEVLQRYGDPLHLDVKPTALDKAIKKANDEIDEELRVAKRLSSRKLHTAKKDLMRATLSEKAVALLETLPSAEALMAEAVAETKELKA